MRLLAFIAAAFLLVVTSGACANDGPPIFVEPKSSASSDEPQQAPLGRPTAVEQARGERQPEAARQSVDNVIMRLTEELEVYQWIGDDWLPVRSFGPRTLLLADGWVEQENGVIWLHLDLNGDLGGWARLNESPVSPEEAQSLPRLAQPVLPTTQLATPDGGQLAVSLLGMSEDKASIAVRFVGSDAVVWVDRWEVEGGQSLGWLPVYTGTVSGRWEPWHLVEGGRVVVQVYNWNSDLAAWPGGPISEWRLQTGSYPVLGRSLDGKWLALRVDTLDPPVVWRSAVGLELDFDPSELPIFLSAGLDVVTIDSDGRAVSSSFAPELPSYWEWRTAKELLLSEWDVGSWLWDTESGETRRFSDRNLANVSPNGAFAVDVFQADEDAPIDWNEPRHVALVSLDNGREVVFEEAHKPWGTDAPGFQQFWSADSRWLLSTVARYGDEEETTRHFALSVNGELVEIAPPEGEWVSSWGALQRVEQAGGTLRYFNAAGQEIERPWSDEVFGADAAASRDYPELSDGWWPRNWSPDGEWLMATRAQFTNEFDENGVAALPWVVRRGWGIYEIGVFDREGALRQVFRGFGGLDCGQWTSMPTWSPDGSRIVFGPRRTSCA